MELKCLGHKTEIFTLEFNSKIIRKNNYIVIKTPSQPGFFWGNFLLFKNPPKKNSFKKWTDIYKKEFNNENPSFLTLTWDNSEYNKENIKDFLENGFELDICKVLTAQKVNKTNKFNPNIKIKKIETDEDWNSLIDVHIDPDWKYKKEDEIPFIVKRFKTYRAMCDAGLGYRFGAFLNNKIVGDLGIFFKNNIGRFSNVGTHKDFRRIGVCNTLVYLASQYAFNEMKLNDLVMIADEDYHAAKIYESVGFKEYEKMIGLQWIDKSLLKS